LKKYLLTLSKTKAPTPQCAALLFTPDSLRGLCGSFSFCPPLFHHFGNAFFGCGAETTAATFPSPAIPKPSLSAVSTLQGSNGLLQTVFFVS